ncbi:XI-E [Symbiodinium natans]|uniref:XI-E protein n=1 Tax=Symbiodinium natans TaxID=878477 RepID=A0A812RU06_9DINO|nr:XI-E [Symbiodinium natans]
MEGRDALARHLYGTIFLYIVRRINDALSPGSARHPSSAQPYVGVLDIFGFEFFEHNSFEQLCINFTNELLQQHFSEVIFEFEAALYAKEAVSWDPGDFPDNKDIVDLIGSIQAPRGLSLEGLLPMLDEEGNLPGGSSTGWFNKLSSKYSNHAIFQVVMRRRGNFLVNHFAGAVEYESRDFLFKNKDTLSPDAMESMKASSSEFLRSRFQEEGRSFGTQTCASTGRVRKAKAYSVSLEFRQQLRELMTSVRSTHPHFIRCIKPNPQNKPQVLHRSSVVEQLRYQGVLEAIRVSRAGYPVRHRHREAVLEYWRLEKPLWSRLEFEVGCGEYAEAASLLFRRLQERVAHVLPDAPGYGLQIGRHMIFMKREVAAFLDAALRKARIEASVQIQARCRERQARLRFRSVREAAVRIQALARGRAARKLAEEMRRQRAATKLQSVQRGRLARREYQAKCQAVATLQGGLRSLLARQRFLAMSSSARQLQSWFHRTVLRIRRRRRTRAALPIQTAWRRVLAKREVQQRREALAAVQRPYRRLLRQWQSQAVQEIREQGLLRPAPEPVGLLAEDHLDEQLEDVPLGKLLAAIASLERCNAALSFEAKATRLSCERLRAELGDLRRNSIPGVIGQVYGNSSFLPAANFVFLDSWHAYWS